MHENKRTIIGVSLTTNFAECNLYYIEYILQDSINNLLLELKNGDILTKVENTGIVILRKDKNLATQYFNKDIATESKRILHDAKILDGACSLFLTSVYIDTKK